MARGENIITKLRDVALPEYASGPPSGMSGSFASANGLSDFEESLHSDSARRAEILLRQSGLSSSAVKGLNLTSQLMVSPGGEYLRESLTAFFPAAAQIPAAPTVTLPLIPSGQRP